MFEEKCHPPNWHLQNNTLKTDFSLHPSTGISIYLVCVHKTSFKSIESKYPRTLNWINYNTVRTPKIIPGVFQLQILRHRGENLEHRLVRITLAFLNFLQSQFIFKIFPDVTNNLNSKDLICRSECCETN